MKMLIKISNENNKFDIERDCSDIFYKKNEEIPKRIKSKVFLSTNEEESEGKSDEIFKEYFNNNNTNNNNNNKPMNECNKNLSETFSRDEQTLFTSVKDRIKFFNEIQQNNVKVLKKSVKNEKEIKNEKNTLAEKINALNLKLNSSDSQKENYKQNLNMKEEITKNSQYSVKEKVNLFNNILHKTGIKLNQNIDNNKMSSYFKKQQNLNNCHENNYEKSCENIKIDKYSNINCENVKKIKLNKIAAKFTSAMEESNMNFDKSKLNHVQAPKSLDTTLKKPKQKLCALVKEKVQFFNKFLNKPENCDNINMNQNVSSFFGAKDKEEIHEKQRKTSISNIKSSFEETTNLEKYEIPKDTNEVEVCVSKKWESNNEDNKKDDIVNNIIPKIEKGKFKLTVKLQTYDYNCTKQKESQTINSILKSLTINRNLKRQKRKNSEDIALEYSPKKAHNYYEPRRPIEENSEENFNSEHNKQDRALKIKQQQIQCTTEVKPEPNIVKVIEISHKKTNKNHENMAILKYIKDINERPIRRVDKSNEDIEEVSKNNEDTFCNISLEHLFHKEQTDPKEEEPEPFEASLKSTEEQSNLQNEDEYILKRTNLRKFSTQILSEMHSLQYPPLQQSPYKEESQKGETLHLYNGYTDDPYEDKNFEEEEYCKNYDNFMNNFEQQGDDNESTKEFGKNSSCVFDYFTSFLGTIEEEEEEDGEEEDEGSMEYESESSNWEKEDIDRALFTKETTYFPWYNEYETETESKFYKQLENNAITKEITGELTSPSLVNNTINEEEKENLEQQLKDSFDGKKPEKLEEIINKAFNMDQELDKIYEDLEFWHNESIQAVPVISKLMESDSCKTSSVISPILQNIFQNLMKRQNLLEKIHQLILVCNQTLKDISETFDFNFNSTKV